MPDLGGVPSLLTALAGAIAPAVVKALVERRRRSPIKSEELTLCRNHSHLTGSLVRATPGLDATEVAILVEQPLTLELSTGARLTLPPYTVCYVRQEHPGAWSDSELRATAERDVAALSRAARASTSGPTMLPR